MNDLRSRVKDLYKIFLRRLDQTTLVKHLEKMDENVGKIISRSRDLNKSSLKYQRRYAYTKSFLWYFGGGVILFSWGAFGTEMKWSTWEIYPDVYYEMLLISSEMTRRVPYAIDYKLTQGVEQGEMEPQTYAALGRIYANLNYPDLAQTAFYMAHIKDHQKIGANSDLQFDTTSKGGQNKTKVISDDE